MKIKITELEATAEELKATRNLSEILVSVLQRALEPYSKEPEEDGEEDGEEE